MFRKLLNIPKSIEIDWAYPRLISSVIDKDILFDWGLYQITSKNSNKESLLYIGKAWHNFNDRIKSHNKKWLDIYDGDKYVRLGHLNTKITEKQLFDIESAIIFDLNPIHNIQSTKTDNPSDEYDIFNTGYRGKVPQFVRTKEH
jgi:GIY-YIG catalytic domain